MPHEPKKRHSTARQGKRRASIKFAKPAVSVCKNCGAIITPHEVCQACGYYKGKNILNIVKKSQNEKQA